MRALVFDGTLLFNPARPDPKPAPGEALIRVRVAGICRTDLEIVKGYMAFHGIPGHEFTGEVVECSEKKRLGKRVVGEINCACDSCITCRKGLKRHCPNRTVLGILNRDGCFAEYLVLPVENLHEIPSDLPDLAAVFTEPTAAAFEILEQTSIEPGMRVAIVGDGKLGLLTAQVINNTGAETHLYGRRPDRSGFLGPLGIHVREPTETGQGDRTAFDVVVEASGSVAGFERATALLRPRGTLVLKSTIASSEPMNLAPVVIDEITIIGSRCGPFDKALTALAGGKIQTQPLVSAQFPLDRGPEAFHLAGQPGTLKVFLTP